MIIFKCLGSSLRCVKESSSIWGWWVRFLVPFCLWFPWELRSHLSLLSNTAYEEGQGLQVCVQRDLIFIRGSYLQGRDLPKIYPRAAWLVILKVTLDDIILTFDGFTAVGTPLLWLSRRRSPTPRPGATCLRCWGEKHKHFLRTRYFKTSTPE